MAVSCTQRETDIGRGVLQDPPTDTFIVMQGTGTVGAEWRPVVSNGRGNTLQIGDAGGFFAFTVMRFNPVAALPESARADCMVVRMIRNRVWPESGAPDLQIRVREIPERWTEDSLLAGYLADRESYPVIVDLVIRADEDTFRFDLPRVLWERWMSGDSAYGVLIEPRSEGALLGFLSEERSDSSGSLGPMLEIYGWKPPSDSLGSDTSLLVRQAAAHDGYLSFDLVDVDTSRLALRQGNAQRAALYFPLDTITAANFARVVNHAELYFYADTSHPANFLYQNIGLLYRDGTMESRRWMTEPDSARAGLLATSSSAFDASNSYIKFDVTSTVAFWVANPDSNTGFQILTSEENGHLTRQVFHSPLSEDISKRPRLVLWLTEEQ